MRRANIKYLLHSRANILAQGDLGFFLMHKKKKHGQNELGAA